MLVSGRLGQMPLVRCRRGDDRAPGLTLTSLSLLALPVTNTKGARRPSVGVEEISLALACLTE